MAAWVASMISSCLPANQPCWGIPPCPRSSRGLLGGGRTWGAQCCLGTQVLWFEAHQGLLQPLSLPWPAGTCGQFPPRTRIPVGQQHPAHRGVHQKLHAESPDSLLTHCSLLLPLVRVINTTGIGFPAPSMGCDIRAEAFLPTAHPAHCQAGHRLVGDRASSPVRFAAWRQICMEKLKLVAETAAAWRWLL